MEVSYLTILVLVWVVLNLKVFFEFFEDGEMYLFGWSLCFYFNGARLLSRAVWVIIFLPAEISFILFYLVPKFISKMIRSMFVRKVV